MHTEMSELDASGLEHMDQQTFNALPFGAIRLDEQGIVIGYNRVEAELSRRTQEETLGKDFFRDVAPCTDNERFRGRLEALVAEGGGSDTFDYRFRFPWGERDVRIRVLVRSGSGDRYIFVTTT